MGEDDDEPEFSSAEPLEEGETFFFTPRGLKNLVLTDELDSLAPILNCEIADLANEDTPQARFLIGQWLLVAEKLINDSFEIFAGQDLNFWHVFLTVTWYKPKKWAIFIYFLKWAIWEFVIIKMAGNEIKNRPFCDFYKDFWE